jgi:hypothetical protein
MNAYIWNYILMGGTEVMRDKPVSAPHFGANFLEYTKLKFCVCKEKERCISNS